MQQLGPYEITGVLGRGGMGKVFAAVNQQTGERAAVKVLAPAYAGDAHFRARFGTEIQSLKKLRHVGIVELYGYGEQDGHLFYAMELVDGKNVAELLREGRTFSWREVVRIGIDICAALRHAHDRGVIHRDLKPANLMLTSDDVVKLTDFGIAKLFGSTQLTFDGGVLGTADFMSPEQADGKAATIRSDLYSLGSVLYAMLARRSPFAASTMAEVIHRLMYDDPPPLERFAPEAPHELSQLIYRLLEKDPEKRIGTALALANRLGEINLDVAEDDAEDADADDASGKKTASLPPGGEASITRNSDVPGAATAVRPTVAYRPLGSGGHSDVTKDAPTSGKTGEGPDAPRESLVTPQAVDHFTTVAPGKGAVADRSDDDRRTIRSSFPLLALLTAAAACLGVLIWLGTRPESADAVFTRIEQASQSGRLSEVEPDIRIFASRFPDDPRRADVETLVERLELQKWERQIELRRRLGSRSLPAPVQLLLDARSIAETDLEAARQRLEALIILLEQSPAQVESEGESAAAEESGISEEKDLRMCLAAARQDLLGVKESLLRDMSLHLKLIDEQLARAESLERDQPQEARRIWQSIITLYADRPWAETRVEQAKQALADSSS